MSDTKTVSHRPMTVKIAGRTLATWTSCEVGRDLADIAGFFRIRYLDEVRSAALLGGGTPEITAIHPRDPVEISINGQVVLKGWVDDINLTADEHTAEAIISGRDVTGDLVDCSANPTGPGEYRQIRLESLVGHLTNPYKITLDQQIETGAPFTLVALEPGDTVMDAIEHHARQRGVLVTSDGIGKIVLTQAGTTRASDSLSFPGNVRGIEVRISSRNRHSDVWVKGQFKSQLRPAKTTLDANAAPLSAAPSQPPAAPSHRKVELASTTRYGHWVDPEVQRYRPRVWMAKTQSGGSVATQQTTNPPLDSTAQGLSDEVGPPLAFHAGTRHKQRKATKPREDADPWTLQDQAEWRGRTTRAGSTAHVYIVPGLRNSKGDLWLPNQLVSVTDLYSGLTQDMLIGAVTWVASDQGYETRISVVAPDAYNLKGDEDHTRAGARKSSHLTARSLIGRS
ncbi:phage baseplate assembly protein [Asaia bogorensis]|uniref:phage baseplate assembly protein n=1 Tax=Asaia bogorensis TaxID=91915 RepID=UPI000EFB23AB|nr:hypothetical protein [Asaia bogorensis]